jgi:3D (Asp-Asp-Asp) domain-containing protein
MFRGRHVRVLAGVMTVVNIVLLAGLTVSASLRIWNFDDADPVSLSALDPVVAAPVAAAIPTAHSLVVVEPAYPSADVAAAPDPSLPAVAGTSVPLVTRPMYNGRPIRPVRTMHMLVTAYSPDERSCGKFADGFTASGYSVWTNGMKLVAADTRLLPFGTIITIPGYHDGKPVPVLDRGGKIKGHRLDVLYPTHEVALKWGVQKLDVTVWEYAD